MCGWRLWILDFSCGLGESIMIPHLFLVETVFVCRNNGEKWNIAARFDTHIFAETVSHSCRQHITVQLYSRSSLLGKPVILLQSSEAITVQKDSQTLSLRHLPPPDLGTSAMELQEMIVEGIVAEE
jgi:hypothetical protein